MTRRLRRTFLAAFAAVLMAGATAAPAPAANATHTIAHRVGSDRATILTGNGAGQLFYLDRGYYRTGVTKFFIPGGCRGYERAFFVNRWYVKYDFGMGPRWATVSGHGHQRHDVDVQC